MSLADIINSIIAAATIAAAVFAFVQIRHAIRERSAAKQAEIDGVAVQWFPKVRPHTASADGSAVWQYEIAVRNPGSLPIRDVTVDLRFAVPIRRQHFDENVDPETRTLQLVQPVILGLGVRDWRRTIRMPYDQHSALEQTTADVTFTTLAGERRTNHMDGRPPTIHEPDPRR